MGEQSHTSIEPDQCVGVLVVDGDRDRLDRTASSLESRGVEFRIETARTTGEAIDRLEGGIECVVSASDAGDESGIEFLRTVRETHPDLPFVLFTGTGSERVASEAIAAGATDYLPRDEYDDQYRVLADRIDRAVERYWSERLEEETRRRLRELTEQSADVLWMVSADWSELLYVNSAYEEVWGRPIATLEDDPRSFLDAVHPDDRDRVRTGMERASEGESVDMEYRIEVEDGERILWGTAEPILEDDGEVVRVAGFVRDVTARSARERELARKTRAIDAAPIGITISDPAREDNPLVYVNQRFTEMTGYDESEVLGRNCRFLQGEDTDPGTVAEMREAIDRGEPVSVELRNYRKDGTVFWNRVSIAPVRKDGRIVNFVGFQQDVTEEKARERALREEREFIDQSLDALEDVFYVFNTDGEIVRWNRRVPEVTGYAEEELEGMHATEFFPEDHQERVAEAVGEVFESGTASVEADYLTKDGERIPYEFTGTRLTDPDGKVLGFAGIGRDLSERLEYQRELERRNEQLEEFASIVSHDLRNPLNLANGHLDLVREEHDSDDLDVVADALDRMERLIEDLLTLAREGEIALDPEPIPLREAVEACRDGVEVSGASLEIETDLTIRADEGRLQQLLENLFRNATEHGRDDVRITVGELGDGSGFYVADDGPGIPVEERELVFEDGYSTGEEGIGAGLSIVSRVAESHDWEVRATESAEGGARFEITGVEVVES